jgi:hypothetical protein
LFLKFCKLFPTYLFIIKTRCVYDLLSNKKKDPCVVFKTPPTVSRTLPYDLELDSELRTGNIAVYGNIFVKRNYDLGICRPIIIPS